MKKFLKYSIILVSLLFITIISVEIFVRSLPNSYKTKNEYMLNHASEVETLILGSSHSFYDINPGFLDCKAFNLANIAQDLQYDNYLLSHYSDGYRNLKTVIIPISYFTFFSTPCKEQDDHSNLITNYHIYMDCPYGKWQIKYNFEFCYLTVFKGKILAYLKNRVRNCSELGWGNDYISSNKIKDAEVNSAKNAVERHTYNDWKYLKRNLDYFTDIVNFCKVRSIKLVMVTTPKYHSYYDLVDNTTQQKETFRLIEELKNKYDIPYYNYLKDPRFVADDFYDADHLNEKGAEKFTKIINAEIEEFD
jgi:hypothetical protein